MPSIAGRYENYKSENMDEHMAAVGLPFIVRKMISAMYPIVEIIIEGDMVTIRTVTKLKTMEDKLQLGEEYDEKLPNDKTMKSITTIVSDNEMVTTSVVPETGMETRRQIIFSDEGCIVTTTSEKSSKPGVRYFKRIN